jgi:hypothetical protein
MLSKNKRTSDSQLDRAPAALGTALTGYLMDTSGQRLGEGFPVKMTVAHAGMTENENTVTVIADRIATVNSMSLFRGGQEILTVALNSQATVRAGDSVCFQAGSMSITADGPLNAALVETLTGPYVIDEEPTLD